jgi:hypothetical protein
LEWDENWCEVRYDYFCRLEASRAASTQKEPPNAYNNEGTEKRELAIMKIN